MITRSAPRKPVAPDGQGRNEWLTDLLKNPSFEVASAELPALWRYCDIDINCEIPPLFQPGLWMTRSLRGAVGRYLLDMHQQTERSKKGATAFEVFYQHHLQVRRMHVPRPVRFTVTARKNAICIKVRIFGQASAWRDELLAALIASLSKGIGLKENGSILKPWPVADWAWSETRGLPSMNSDEARLIRFQTPFKAGQSRIYKGNLTKSFGSMIERIALLARWQGMIVRDADIRRIASDLREIKLTSMIDAPRVDGFVCKIDGTNLSTLAGPVLSEIASDPSPEVVQWLQLGSHYQVGGYGAYGFGQFELL